jgi:hypothetical protein
MFQMLAGPIVFAVGLTLIFVAVHGAPRAPVLGLFGRSRPRRRTPVNGFTSGDALVGEMLTEMVTLREQLAELRQQVESKPARRRPAKLAS